eukprot:UN30488
MAERFSKGVNDAKLNSSMKSLNLNFKIKRLPEWISNILIINRGMTRVFYDKESRGLFTVQAVCTIVAIPLIVFILGYGVENPAMLTCITAITIWLQVANDLAQTIRFGLFEVNYFKQRKHSLIPVSTKHYLLWSGLLQTILFRFWLIIPAPLFWLISGLTFKSFAGIYIISLIFTVPVYQYLSWRMLIHLTFVNVYTDVIVCSFFNACQWIINR